MKPPVDHDSVDWTVVSRLPRRPKIDVQMKSHGMEDADEEDFIRYDLKRKNYDDLILTDVINLTESHSRADFLLTMRLTFVGFGNEIRLRLAFAGAAR